MTDSLFEIIVHETLDSTNEEARRRLAEELITQPTIIRAKHQTAGRGTQGRRWISPQGKGLYLSIVHPFHADAASVPVTPLFTLAAGVACAEVLREMAKLAVQLKPVNDLYLEGRKLGGILVESILSHENNRAACKAIITGIGINVYEDTDVLAACENDARAALPISLQAAIPPALFDRWQGDAIMQELTHALAEAVNQRYRQLIKGDAPGIVRDYLQSKLPGLELPPDVARLLPPGCLPVC